MKSDKLWMLGGVAVVAIGAYLGVSSVLKAGALESQRVDGINKARSIGAFISRDEATFGTAFRDALSACVSEVSQEMLPNVVWDHYRDVLKSAVTKASDENYTPRDNRRWFLEAQRAAAAESPLPEAVLARLGAAEKAKVEAALTNIDSQMIMVGECLVQAAQK
jgi:hypothetical protein